MKTWIILITLMLFGCGGQEANESPASDIATKGENNKTTSATQSVSASPKTIGTACESVETDEVASAMGWDAGKTVAEEQLNMKDGRLTVCMFRLQGGEVQVLVRVSHESEKAQANKILERAYQTDLNQTGEKFSYVKIPTIIGTESIIGEGEGNHGYQVYILRNRFDNATDTTLEMSVNQGEADTRKNQLKAIAAAMD